MGNRKSIAMGSSASCISHIGANSELGRNIDKGKRRAKTVEEKALKVIRRKSLSSLCSMVAYDNLAFFASYVPSSALTLMRDRASAPRPSYAEEFACCAII